MDRRADRIVDRDPAAQPTGFADHALPRQVVARLARLECGRGDASAVRDPRELGDLRVGRDPALGDRADHDVDPAEQLLQMRCIV